jgi:pimeloyl-ACP methyl ester carboxylesterase
MSLLITRITPRLLAVTTAAAALAAFVLISASPSPAAQKAKPKPTVVLVHGAFTDASSWTGVIKRLQRAGYAVRAPANPLRSLTGDSAYLASVLEDVDGPIVLAGHSYGGSVISNTAAQDPDVKALVYVSAFIPEVGESALALTGKFAGSELPPALHAVPYPDPADPEAADLYVVPEAFRSVFTGPTIGQRRALALAAAQRPFGTHAVGEPAQAAAWKTIPSWSLYGTRDKIIPPATHRFMSERAGARTTTINTSHATPLTMPSAVADVIERAVSATD